MTTPSTNIGIADIFIEANGSGGTDISFADLARISFFEGAGGSGAFAFNGYGRQGNTIGANRIFGLSVQNTPQAIGDFTSKDYFYNGTTFNIFLQFDNQLPIPSFPFPPFGNDFTVQLELFDSTDTFQYATGSIGAVAQATGLINIEQASVTPLINLAYWRMTISSDPQGGGGTTNLDINGTNFVNTTSPSGGSQLILDFVTFGTSSVSTTFSGLDFFVTFT